MKPILYVKEQFFRNTNEKLYVSHDYPNCSEGNGLVSIKPYCSNLSNFRWFLGFSSRQGLENLDECHTEIFLATYSADGVALKKET